jgi:hypothetical protein
VRRDDAVQELPGVGAVALGDEGVDPEEEPRLVGRGDAGLVQRADGLQVAHAGRSRHRLEAEVPDALVDLVRRVVVGLGDHRGQQLVLVGRQRACRRLAQHGDEQHRLGHAGAAERRVEVATVELAVLGDEGERDRARSRGGVAPGRGDAAVGDEDGLGPVCGLLVAVAASAREREGGGDEDRAVRRGCS